MTSSNHPSDHPFDLIVVGGGHAGSEAALAAARMGIDTLLVTSQISAIAQMPCNPAVGGLAKSHLVYELDALGGEMGKTADVAALQAKILNRSRGPAVWATRTQCAKLEYSLAMQNAIASQTSLSVLEDNVTGISISSQPAASPSQKAVGVTTRTHGFISAKAIVITSGTSLRGRIWVGKTSSESAGDGRPSSNELSSSLAGLGFRLSRLKTGTPPRLVASSCDFSKCTIQPGETPRPMFHVEHCPNYRAG